MTNTLAQRGSPWVNPKRFPMPLVYVVLSMDVLAVNVLVNVNVLVHDMS